MALTLPDSHSVQGSFIVKLHPTPLGLVAVLKFGRRQGGNVKLIVLAAGYATRLYPLTLNQPKPLLPVAGKPMIEYVLDNIAPIGDIDRVYVVTNAKFAGHFQRWSEEYRATKGKLNFTIVNDGSTDDTNKLG